MGDAYVALTGDPDLIFYNPAQLTAARGLGIAAHRFGNATTLTTLSAANALAPGGIGIGVQLLDYAAPVSTFVPGSPERDLLVRGGSIATGAVVTVGYARAVKGVRLGVAAKGIHQQYGNERDGTVAADVGIAYGSAWQVALTGQHLGHGLRLDGARMPLPHRITAGAGVPRREIGPLDLAAGISASHIRDGTFEGSAGTEWSYMPLDGFTFVGRLGVRTNDADGTRATFGAGFVGERFSIDYAFQPITGDGSGHRVGLRWR